MPTWFYERSYYFYHTQKTGINILLLQFDVWQNTRLLKRDLEISLFTGRGFWQVTEIGHGNQKLCFHEHPKQLKTATKRENFAFLPFTSHTSLHPKSHSCCPVSFLKLTLKSVTSLNPIHLSPSLFPFSIDLLLGETDRHQVHKIRTGEWNKVKKKEEKRE